MDNLSWHNEYISSYIWRSTYMLSGHVWTDDIATQCKGIALVPVNYK